MLKNNIRTECFMLIIHYILVLDNCSHEVFLRKSLAYTARKSPSRSKQISQSLETINMKQVYSGEEQQLPD